MPSSLQLLTIDDVCRITSMVQSSVYYLAREADFPRPLKLGRRSRWVESEVLDWVARRSEARSPKGGSRQQTKH